MQLCRQSPFDFIFSFFGCSICELFFLRSSFPCSTFVYSHFALRSHPSPVTSWLLIRNLMNMKENKQENVSHKIQLFISNIGKFARAVQQSIFSFTSCFPSYLYFILFFSPSFRTHVARQFQFYFIFSLLTIRFIDRCRSCGLDSIHCCLLFRFCQLPLCATYIFIFV